MTVDADDLALFELGLDPRRRGPGGNQVGDVRGLRRADVVELENADSSLLAVGTGTLSEIFEHECASQAAPALLRGGNLGAVIVAPGAKVVAEAVLAPMLAAVSAAAAEQLDRLQALAARADSQRAGDHREPDGAKRAKPIDVAGPKAD